MAPRAEAYVDTSALIDDLEPLRMVAVGPDEFVGALQILRKYSDQDLSMTDAEEVTPPPNGPDKS